MQDKINISETLPILLSPLHGHIGLPVALGLRGWPANRIIMIYGPPGGGKSSFAFFVAGEYIKNGDEVWVRETEHALDRVYFSHYLPLPENEKISKDEVEKVSLLHLKSKTESALEKNDRLDESEKFLSPNSIEIMLQRIEIINERLKEIENNIPLEKTRLQKAKVRTLTRTATAEYKLKQVNIQHPRSLEEFESELLSSLEKRKQNKIQKNKRLLVIVDSLSYLLPHEDLAKNTSSEGRGIMTAKYLHTLLPRLLGKIANEEICLLLIVQQTTHIKMNPYEPCSPIQAIQGKGGLAIKFGATLMIGVEQRNKTKDHLGRDVKTGVIKIPKAKLRMGGKGPLEGKFYLRDTTEESSLDFDTPFILDCLSRGELGILKGRGYYYVPESLLLKNENFQELKPLLKSVKTQSENHSYYPCPNDQIITFLRNCPLFVESIMDIYDVSEQI